MSEEQVIETRGLTKEYRRWFRKGNLALQDLSIQVARGSIFGFLGPNGAGKTTTIKILMDLIKPTAGSATILGRPSTDVDIKERIGFLPDSPAFSPQLTAYEFLNICAKLFRLEGKTRHERIEEVLAEVRMAEHRRGRLGSFSRGMLQRIGVAQALLNRPELLILDEPLLGLDPFGRQEFKAIILNQRRKGTSVFLSSHILSDIEEICDRIAILNEGRLICSGTLDELLSATGFRMVLSASLDEVFREIVPDAVEVTRNAEGDRVLTFANDPDLERRLKELQERHPDGIHLHAGHEKLEDFFFRSLGKENADGGGGGGASAGPARG